MAALVAVLIFSTAFVSGYLYAGYRRKALYKRLHSADVRADAQIARYFRAHDLSVARQAQNQLRALYAEVLSGRVR